MLNWPSLRMAAGCYLTRSANSLNLRCLRTSKHSNDFQLGLYWISLKKMIFPDTSMTKCFTFWTQSNLSSTMCISSSDQQNRQKISTSCSTICSQCLTAFAESNATIIVWNCWNNISQGHWHWRKNWYWAALNRLPFRHVWIGWAHHWTMSSKSRNSCGHVPIHKPILLLSTQSERLEFFFISNNNPIFQQFLSATTQAAFVIFLQFKHEEQHLRTDELTIGNAATNEELTVRNAQFKWLKHDIDIHYVEIVRNSIDDKANIREWIKQRAYCEEIYNYNGDDNKMIWIDQLTIG